MADVLTPDEIAALQAAFADAPTTRREPLAGVRTIDLANQERPLEGRLPGLEVVLDRFGRGLRRVLATCFGEVPSVTLSMLGLIRFERLAGRLAEPGGLVRFRLAPLRGTGLIAVPSALVAALLQVSCGGASGGSAPLPAREFSAVELRLLERLAVRILAELAHAWAPVAALDPVRGRLQTMRTDDGATGADAAWAARLRERILAAPVDVTVELGTATMSMSRLLALAAGDLLELETGREGPVVVRVGGEPRFRGAPGVQGGRNAVRITRAA